MKLKYFTEARTERGYGRTGIVFPEKIFSLSKDGNQICFMEECDGYYHQVVSKDEAVEILLEAIAWIEGKKP